MVADGTGAALTVTLQVALLPPAMAVMMALPGLLAVTTPEELTVATDSSLDDQKTIFKMV